MITNEYILELLPVVSAGLIASVISYLKGMSKEKRFEDILVGTFLCVVIYLILSITDYPYTAKIGISSAIAFLGIDKTLDIVHKIFNFRNLK